MNPWKYNIFIKIGIILVLVMLLLIPTVMIRGLVKERESRHQQAVLEVSSKWGEQQTLTGPFITIPYYRYYKESDVYQKEKIVKVLDHMHFLPEELTFSGNIIPERRHRGIYEVVLYNADLKVSGVFNNIDYEQFDIKEEDILFDNAVISIGITDLRGLEEQVSLKFNDKSGLFDPGVVSQNIISSGIHAPVSLCVDSCDYTFDFKLKLNGSQLLNFVPMGKVTDVDISSNWPDPSFDGAFLPDGHDISSDGFSAKWNVLHLNRNYPQAWTGNQHYVSDSQFGVNLFMPVDTYTKTERSVKYAILFIALTFMVFFFVEVLAKRFIHPIQYILVGIALIVFFSLLLAISEHLSFNNAYIISAVSVLTLISTYIRAILKSTRLTLMISGILTILYTFIFIILQIQDYALLTGSIGIFVILALVMYFSRKIDWYSIRIDQSRETEEQ